MEVKYAFHLKHRHQITGLACFANAHNRRANRSLEVDLSKLILKKEQAFYDTDELFIAFNDSTFNYSLVFPDAEINVTLNEPDDNYFVSLKGTNEILLARIYNHFIKKNMPKKTIYCKADGKLLQLSPHQEEEGFLVIDAQTEEALHFLSNEKMQNVLKHGELEKHEEYYLMRFPDESIAPQLLL